jgi:hypothetical protein
VLPRELLNALLPCIAVINRYTLLLLLLLLLPLLSWTDRHGPE